MKKVSIFMMLTLILSACFAFSSPVDAKNPLNGIWRCDSVEMTFVEDTLTIDEIGNEGFEYNYHVSNDTIYYYDCLDNTEFAIKIISVTDSVFTFYYLDFPQEVLYFHKSEYALFVNNGDNGDDE